VLHWADLQSVHGFRCYDNIAPRVLAVGDSIRAKVANPKCQRVHTCTRSMPGLTTAVIMPAQISGDGRNVCDL